MFNLANSVAMASVGAGCTYLSLSQSADASSFHRVMASVLVSMSGSIGVVASNLMHQNAANIGERRVAEVAKIISWGLLIVGTVEFFSEIITSLSVRDIN